ncbi:hypothetical protein ACXITP_02540 [Actinotignum sanguinis]|uniref:Uncharacterized protein n=2 Tax=Actinomycetaceae TaxID=2049 RepID=A0ABZ0RC94_9ACTO|nr:hypothetical protein [Actinotignum sanguinis]MDY5126543.1 hypothetical protein [Actinotignum sp. SLA_B059]WPJ89751.1 hypothetical protein R0V15_03950 [Schaalia turicensis]MDE1552081.1 hypothetical protein [Actinotignum sanguinis]MDE1566520.1 hypothetical protein [Actinotignum sanguinis]MDE1578028.1 hypothetical protein [Actinotignum sanguinis]
MNEILPEDVQVALSLGPPPGSVLDLAYSRWPLRIATLSWYLPASGG